MANRAYPVSQPSALDRTIDLSAIRWSAVAWAVVLVVAIGLRFGQLDRFALSPSEGEHAYDAWVFYRGGNTDPGQTLPNTSPVFLILQAFSYFLFGGTDVTARLMPALLGVLMIPLIAALRPFVGRPAALGMAALAAFSPTLVYASRTGSAEIAVAFFSLLVFVGFLRMGYRESSLATRRAWCLAFGAGLALMLGSGPVAITMMISLGIGLLVGLAAGGPDGGIRRSINELATSREAALIALAGFAIALIACFSRLLSDLGALAGIGETFADWGRLLTTAASATPTQFFILSLVLYESIAIVLAIGTVSRFSRPPGGVGWPVFSGWFAAGLLLCSFSSGRVPEHAVLVALPLVLLAGGGLGRLLADLDRTEFIRGPGGLLFATALLFILAALALLALLGRLDTAADTNRARIEAMIVGALVVIPLAIAGIYLIRRLRLNGESSQAGTIVLCAVLVFLTALTVRTTILLNFFNIDDGTELLAQRTSSAAVQPLVTRLTNLSRDETLTESSIEDPTGGHGLSLAIDRRVQWPYRWYFREFPNATVAPEGQAALSGAEVVIAPDNAGMAEAGYTPSTYYPVNRIPGAYLAPSMGDIIQDLVVPTHWDTSVRYLLFRELETQAEPESIAVGLSGTLATRIYPNTGPFNLFERVGPGNGRGQFNQPRGIAVSSTDGTVYVVDMGNARVQRFGATGDFVGAWGGEVGGVTFSQTDRGLGPTGIAVGADGLIFVADTWGHRIMVLDQDGRSVREFGAFGDTADAPTAEGQPGAFFGPRAIAVTADEIYVVDTGNERVQVFSLDGTFRRAWGGYGSEPGQFIEPVGIAIGPDDRIYVADSGNARISVFATSGTPLAEWTVEAWSGRQFFEPYLAFGPDGYLYATSSQSGSIEVFTPAGDFVQSLTEASGEPLEAPVGIGAAPDGAMLITDTARSAVYRYLPPPPAEAVEAVNQAPAGSPVASPAASPVASPAGSPAASPIGTPVPET
jgi:uncharacterized protein (TIGR03663 family)